jgi:hypothetical protein
MMIASGTLVVLIILISVVSSFSYVDAEGRNSLARRAERWIFFSRICQLFYVLLILIFMYQLTYFFFKDGSLPVLPIPITNPQYKTTLTWGIPALILLQMADTIITFSILELVVVILNRFAQNILANKRVLNSLIFISQLLIARIGISFMVTMVDTGRFTIKFEYVMIYAMMVVFIKIFVHYREKMMEDF